MTTVVVAGGFCGAYHFDSGDKSRKWNLNVEQGQTECDAGNRRAYSGGVASRVNLSSDPWPRARFELNLR